MRATEKVKGYVSERSKGLIHLMLLGLAVVCGVYNSTKPKTRNKFLTLFYGVVVGVEMCCIVDHYGKEEICDTLN